MKAAGTVATVGPEVEVGLSFLVEVKPLGGGRSVDREKVVEVVLHLLLTKVSVDRIWLDAMRVEGSKFPWTDIGTAAGQKDVGDGAKVRVKTGAAVVGERPVGEGGEIGGRF